MSADRDVDRIVRSWLEEGVTVLPDRVLDGVLDQLPLTPQRRSWWPARRYAQMNTLARAAIAAVAVLVVAVIAYNIIPGRGPEVGATPSPLASPGPSPTVPPEVPLGLVPAGTYSFPAQFTTTPFTFTLPAGWTVDANGFVEKGDWGVNGAMLTTWTITHVYDDACRDRSVVETGSGDALLAALVAQTGHATSSPAEVTLGGLPVTRIELSLAADFDKVVCDDDLVRLWPDPGPDLSGGFVMNPGNTVAIYIIEVSGQVTALLTAWHESASASDLQQLQGIVDSIEFRP